MDPDNVKLLETLRNRVGTLQWKELQISRNLTYANITSPNAEIRRFLDESAYRVSVLQKLSTQLKHYYKDHLLGLD